MSRGRTCACEDRPTQVDDAIRVLQEAIKQGGWMLFFGGGGVDGFVGEESGERAPLGVLLGWAIDIGRAAERSAMPTCGPLWTN
jgi:hypothetical protein